MATPTTCTLGAPPTSSGMARRRCGGVLRSVAAHLAAEGAAECYIRDIGNGVLATCVRRPSEAAAPAVGDEGLQLVPLPQPLTFGVEARGVDVCRADWASATGAALAAQLRAALYRYGVLIIPGQLDFDPAAQVRLGHALADGMRLFPPEDPGSARPDVIEDEHDHREITHLMYYSTDGGAVSASPFEADEDTAAFGDTGGFEWHVRAVATPCPSTLPLCSLSL